MTALWTAEDLARATGGAMTRPFHADGVSIDSRSIAPGEVFVALRTDSNDGHGYVADALAKGAAGAIVHGREGLPDDAPLLLVNDTMEALRALGAAARQRYEGALVAITGSVGKTTTKEMLRVALGSCGPTHAAAASYNNHLGVPLTLARMPAGAAYAVVEIGMNNPGEIAPLSRVAMPDVAVITTVAANHIGNLGSLEAIADEKACIMAGLPAGGAAILPRDNGQYSRLLAARPDGTRLITFGEDDILACAADAEGSDVRARLANIEVSFRLNVPGRHMVTNALIALLAAEALGADPLACAAALAGFQAVSGRGVQRRLPSGALLLDESYNASSASVRAALAVLRLLPAERRVAVLGDMLELGDFRDSEHLGLAPAVIESADVVYACGPGMKILFDALPAARRGAHTHTSEDLAPIVVDAVRAGDAVLVKGSLGSRMRRVVEALEKAAG